MATIGPKANLWFKSFDYKRSGCPSCDSGEDPSPMLRLCCEHLVDEAGESTAPQTWSIKYPCSTGLRKRWGSADAVCTDKDFETVLDSALVTLWKDCVVGCTWSARRKTLGGYPDFPSEGVDTTDACCAAKWYASPAVGGGQTETVDEGYWGSDTLYDNPNCRPWVLEVTSPTTATLTYTYRDGTSVTYVPVRSPWQPLDNPQEWVVTPETVANRGVLPCALCVVPNTDPGFGLRPCRKAIDTCGCCDDYECEGSIRIVIECPDEDLEYTGNPLRYQWEDDEGNPNILDCDSPFRLPTINPFGSFPAAFADFPATYENAPCGVFYGSVGVFLVMFACIGESTYHLRIACPDLDTGVNTVIYDGQPTFTCTCRGGVFEFSIGEQNCVECPGGGEPVVTDCCAEPIDATLTASVELFGYDSGTSTYTSIQTLTVTLTYGTIPAIYSAPVTNGWFGISSPTSYCGEVVDVALWCNAGTFTLSFNQRLTPSDAFFVATGGNTPPSVVSCDPVLIKTQSFPTPQDMISYSCGGSYSYAAVAIEIT